VGTGATRQGHTRGVTAHDIGNAAKD